MPLRELTDFSSLPALKPEFVMRRPAEGLPDPLGQPARNLLRQLLRLLGAKQLCYLAPKVSFLAGQADTAALGISNDLSIDRPANAAKALEGEREGERHRTKKEHGAC